MIELSVALVFVALIARDSFKFWVKHLDMQTFQGKQIELLRSEIEQLRAASTRTQELNAGVFTDWNRKFKELEAGNDQMRRHIDSQVAGTIAQLPATGRGFGR